MTKHSQFRILHSVQRINKRKDRAYIAEFTLRKIIRIQTGFHVYLQRLSHNGTHYTMRRHLRRKRSRIIHDTSMLMDRNHEMLAQFG